MSRLSARKFLSVVTCVASLLGILSVSYTAHAQGLYQSPAPSLATGTVPQGVATADFARSGFQSLVVTDSTNRNMKVYLATGPNTFAPAVTYTTCTDPTAVVTADFTGDGYPDIAVACTSANSIEAFVNNGAGGFDANITENVTRPVALAVGNFYAKGPAGLAVARGSGGVTIFLNIAETLVIKTAAVSGTLSGIATSDFDHDGYLDLAVSDSANNNVHILKGDGVGNFTSSGSYSTGNGTNPSGIVTADFNNDGNADLATSNPGRDTATILLGSATGAFTVQAAQATGNNPIGIAVADVNSDGHPDVVAFDSFSTTTGAVAVLLGNGNGTLQTAQISNQAFRPGTVSAVADFNRDGKPDLAVTQQNSNLVSVLLNNTLPTQYPAVGNPYGRSFAAANQSVNGYGNMADSVAVGDFNQDGLQDVAVTYLEDNVVRVLLNTGTGPSNFTTAVPYAVGKQPYWVASGDLNGDGYPDLVVTNTTDNTISVLLNNGKSGNGTFAAATTYTVGKSPFQVAIGDVNGDGIPDLAVSNFGDGTVSVLFGQTGGTFIPASTLTVGTGTNPYGVAIGDFSRNGFPGIAVTSNQTSQLYVFPNNGNGTFGTPFITATDTAPGTLVVGDFNRDGKLDIVTGNTTANDVSFFAGNGNGTFADGATSPSLNFPNTIAAGDVNGDGILDIVGVSPNFNDVEVTLGNGNGLFGTFLQRAAGIFPAAKQPWGVALADFNNDGQLDIVTANAFYVLNIASPSSQARYMTQFPPIPAGNPSIDVLTNISAANIALTSSPASPIPANNTGVTLTATVTPVLSGAGTPTGSVMFEDATGTPLGTGPYSLNGGVATYNTGHLGSGQNLFTTLYSGDANFQPTTVSGSNTVVTVAGTPVTLSLNPSSLGYGSSFVATVTVVGNATTGSYPRGTATIFAVSGGTTVNLGTTNNLQQVGGGNTSSRTITITASTPDLNVGTYQLYAVYNPSNGTYPTGTSSDEALTITTTPTSLNISCSGGLFGASCTATVTSSLTGDPVLRGYTVNFSVNGGTQHSETIGNNGRATYNFSALLGFFSVTATFPQQDGYLASSDNSGSICLIFCGLARTSSNNTPGLFNGLGFTNNFSTPAPSRNGSRTSLFSLF